MAKIDATLEPLLGADRFRAGASVECDLTSGEQQEETFDPTHSVMVSSQKTEDVTEHAGRLRDSGDRLQPARSQALPPPRDRRRHLAPHRERHLPDQPDHPPDAASRRA